jgi:hypothetical protein
MGQRSWWCAVDNGTLSAQRTCVLVLSREDASCDWSAELTLLLSVMSGAPRYEPPGGAASVLDGELRLESLLFDGDLPELRKFLEQMRLLQTTARVQVTHSYLAVLERLARVLSSGRASSAGTEQSRANSLLLYTMRYLQEQLDTITSDNSEPDQVSAKRRLTSRLRALETAVDRPLLPSPAAAVVPSSPPPASPPLSAGSSAMASDNLQPVIARMKVLCRSPLPAEAVHMDDRFAVGCEAFSTFCRGVEAALAGLSHSGRALCLRETFASLEDWIARLQSNLLDKTVPSDMRDAKRQKAKEIDNWLARLKRDAEDDAMNTLTKPGGSWRPL